MQDVVGFSDDGQRFGFRLVYRKAGIVLLLGGIVPLYGALFHPDEINGPAWVPLCVGIVLMLVGINLVGRRRIGYFDRTQNRFLLASSWFWRERRLEGTLDEIDHLELKWGKASNPSS